jgi:hypothetical protein
MKFISSKFLLVLVGTTGLLAGCATNSRQLSSNQNTGGPHTAASNIGVAGWDARWSNYGEYQQRMIKTVQAEWDNLLNDSGVLPPDHTYVAVTFRLNSEGNVSKIVKVEGDAGDLGQKYCVSAIANRGSYGKWTDDMVARMGPEQELKFTFYYEQ